ncbi:hypothetical protein T484DRAFT_1763381 [Baffinella frigidus]|nr:hypothetical protein T484DRAFT_1763381 [Cryptophyta sp. CCMP2293]
MTRQSPRTVGFGVRVTGHAGAQEPAGGAVPRVTVTRRDTELALRPVISEKVASTARLCPCTPPAAGPQAKNLRERRRSVAAAVVQELRSAATDLRAGRKDRGDLNQWWSAHAPEELEEDISAKRVAFIESKQAQNCHDRFDVLNTCNVLGLAFSAKTSCNAMFYGRDLPAYRPGDATALVNKEPRTYSSSCGGKHEKTVRLCGCGYKKGGSTSSRTFHTAGSGGDVITVPLTILP